MVDYAVATFWYGTKNTHAVGEAFSVANLETEAAAPVWYHTNEPAEKEVLLELNPGEGNPRNSEGDFLKLEDGRILFVYTQYDGSSSVDHAPAHLAASTSSSSSTSRLMP